MTRPLMPRERRTSFSARCVCAYLISWERPFSFPVFGGADDVRCANAVGRFPHLVLFILAGESVHVLAFMHPRQRPGYWQHRLPGAI